MNYKIIKIITVSVHLLIPFFIFSQVQAEEKSNTSFKLTNKYIKKIVENRAYDETSLRWRDIKISKNSKFGCATFNAKNLYGAYAGYSTMGFRVQENNSVGWVLNDEICYELLSESNYRETPEGRIKYEKEQRDLKVAEKKREQEIEISRIQSEKESENYRIQKEKEETQRILDNEKYNKELDEKQARDEAEMNELIRLERLKGKSVATPVNELENFLPKKLFDLLPK